MCTGTLEAARGPCLSGPMVTERVVWYGRTLSFLRVCQQGNFPAVVSSELKYVGGAMASALLRACAVLFGVAELAPGSFIKLSGTRSPPSTPHSRSGSGIQTAIQTQAVTTFEFLSWRGTLNKRSRAG